jgi:putative tricarboxylic transport membrane protein
MSSKQLALPQLAVGAGVLVLGALMAWGATGISGEAGYGGVGPNALPWLVSLALLACGGFLVYEAASGGFRHLESAESEPAAGEGGAPGADWIALAWVAAGIVANAALITTAGFIASCTLCFVLAVRGLRHAEGRPQGGARGVALDVATGALISAPAFWLFTKLLGINLPGLTSTGWL